MDLVNVINIYAGHILCSYSLKVGEGNGLLTQLVNYYKGHIIAMFVFQE